MNRIKVIRCDPTKGEGITPKIASYLEKDYWVQLVLSLEQKAYIPEDLLPRGPGLIMNSGGSMREPHQCIHPVNNLDLSALASGQWLMSEGLEPSNCQIFNSLPINHVSGLMSWWRSRNWGAKYIWLNPLLMKSPESLEKHTRSLFFSTVKHHITSLVPTQVIRLLNHPAGVAWLQSFSLIWVGGSSLQEEYAQQARRLGIRLSPCYGTTETAAMISAQAPTDFLIGKSNSGKLLNDVEISLGEKNCLKIKTSRLAKGYWIDGKLEKLRDEEGWWESGDVAELTNRSNKCQLKIIGRLDNAIQSGGETVFPDYLQRKLIKAAEKNNIYIDKILLIPVKDEVWGHRIIALLKFMDKDKGINFSSMVTKLKFVVKDWAPSERPAVWYNCPELAMNDFGKWELQKWKLWVKSKEELHHH